MGDRCLYQCVDNQTSTSLGGTLQGSSAGSFSSCWLLLDEERAQIRFYFIFFHFNLNLFCVCVTIPDCSRARLSDSLCCTELVEFLY